MVQARRSSTYRSAAVAFLMVAASIGCTDSGDNEIVSPEATSGRGGGGAAGGSGAGGAGDPGVEALLALGEGKDKPIFDTHIHIFQVDRPGGVPWPTMDNPHLYRNVLPADYEAVARPLGIVASGIVEASPLPTDTRWVLDRVADNPFFPFYVAQLPIGAPMFDAQLAQIAVDPRVVGIRGYLWGPSEGITLDEAQLGDLRELARRGMTLDLISRYSLNPKDKVLELAKAVPELRIIIDHLAGARSDTVEPAWKEAIEALGRQPNVYVKFSSFFDMFNPSPTGDESMPWTSPTALEAYTPHFDVLLDAFGPDRLVFGSNYPVVAMGGTLEAEIALAEAYLASKGKEVRDKVMFKNAIYFYRRLPH